MTLRKAQIKKPQAATSNVPKKSNRMFNQRLLMVNKYVTRRLLSSNSILVALNRSVAS